jgi:hypothetical protein
MPNTDDTGDLELSQTDAENVTGGRTTPIHKPKKKHGTPAQTSYVVHAAPLGATSDGSLSQAELESDPDC